MVIDDEEDMKVRATFNAYNDEDISVYAHARSYQNAMYTIKEYLRSLIKYGHYFKTIDEALEMIQTKVLDICSEEHLPWE